jgi:hypothetical protein
MAVFCLLGCTATKRESVKTQLSAVLQLAYENGGKAAVSNRIEELVVEGKLSQEQASQLQALAEIACEKLIIDLARGGAVEDTNPTGNGGSSDGCTISPPCDANADGGDGATQAKGDAASS